VGSEAEYSASIFVRGIDYMWRKSVQWMEIILLENDQQINTIQHTFVHCYEMLLKHLKEI
jgi:hypothetical protein